MILAAHGLGGLRDLISLVRSRPLPDYAPHAAIPTGDVAVVTFDCDLRAPLATLTHALPAVTWTCFGDAIWFAAKAAREGACAALVANLRALTERIHEDRMPPGLGWPTYGGRDV